MKITAELLYLLISWWFSQQTQTALCVFPELDRRRRHLDRGGQDDHGHSGQEHDLGQHHLALLARINGQEIARARRLVLDVNTSENKPLALVL